MAISPELVQLLVCPETRSPLALADDALVAQLNEAIAAGKLKNKVGKPVETRLNGALVRGDRQVAYAIVDDIPVMLGDDAIPLKQLGG